LYHDTDLGLSILYTIS